MQEPRRHRGERGERGDHRGGKPVLGLGDHVPAFLLRAFRFDDYVASAAEEPTEEPAQDVAEAVEPAAPIAEPAPVLAAPKKPRTRRKAPAPEAA